MNRWVLSTAGLLLIDLRATAFVLEQSRFLRTIRRMSASSDGNSGLVGNGTTTIRCLGLHGSGGDKAGFLETLRPFGMNVHTIDGPFPKGEGYCWWTMPPGVRSFNAESYLGFEESAARVTNALEETDVPYDVVFAHSQGAILISALLATNRIKAHPPLGYVLNGVAWPNPFAKDLESLQVTAADTPRVLVVIGEQDRINPPSGARQVTDCLLDAGLAVTTHVHPGGHSVPVQDPNARKAISEWLTKTTASSS